VDDKPVLDARDLARKISGMAPGATVKLGIIRKAERKTISVTLGELPSLRDARAEQDMPNREGHADGTNLGLSLAPAGKEPGVVVTEVDPSSPSADFGFKAGDVILEVGGKTVATPAEVRRALRGRPCRGQAKHFVACEVGAGDAVRGDTARPRLSRRPYPRMVRILSGSHAGQSSGRFVGIRRPRRQSEPGGRAQGPSPLIPSSFAGNRRPRRERGWSRGGGAIRRPSLYFWAKRLILLKWADAGTDAAGIPELHCAATRPERLADRGC
jgi:hypothetical protein